MSRRSKIEINSLKAELYNLCWEHQPVTVRQVFYLAVSAGIIEKTEGEYKTTVCRLLAEMRLNHELPFNWVTDNTRYVDQPNTHSSLEQCLEDTRRFYRRALWDNQPERVEIWLEKDALRGVLGEITHKWDVPLFVTRGYPSLSYVYSAADYIKADPRRTNIYYFGDYDPSGVNIPVTIERRLNEFVGQPGKINFIRAAVNHDQISEYKLQTRPTKKTDSRAKNFKGESVEVDAIPPRALKDLVKALILENIDHDQMRIVRAAEDSEREALKLFQL